MDTFTNLHTHSHYSLLNALPKIDDLVKKAKELGFKSLALTDIGNLYGAIEFFKECQKKEIKPIIGVDFYLAPRKMTDKDGSLDKPRQKILLLAKNETGYKNLIKLVTAGHLEGFYYKPRIDREILEKHKDGLIAISPYFYGEIKESVLIGDLEKADSIFQFYKNKVI
jgi:DNA polymerase-3 subunit alpha